MKNGSLLTAERGVVMRGFRRTVVACMIMAVVSATAASASDIGKPSTAGGDGGGATPTTPPGTTMCFMSSGAGSNYNVAVEYLFGAYSLGVSLDFGVPSGVFTARQRFVSEGADGGITSDSGWQDNMMGSSGNPILYDGPSEGTTSQFLADPNGSLDVSGGTQYTVELTNTDTGQTLEADGETYPPDPIAGNC
jgi:hypothetical protein